MALTVEEYKLVMDRIDELRKQVEDHKSYVEKLERDLPTDLPERADSISRAKWQARWSKLELLGELPSKLWGDLWLQIRKELPIVSDPRGPGTDGWFALSWDGYLYQKDIVRLSKTAHTYLGKVVQSTELALNPPDFAHRLTQEGIDKIHDILEADRNIEFGQVLQAHKLLSKSISQKETEILIKELEEAGVLDESQIPE